MESVVRTVGLMWHTISILRLVHPDHGDWRPDGWNLYARLALSRIASGQEHTLSERLQLSSHICVLERNYFPYRTLKGVRPCCWDVRTNVTWSSSKLRNTEESQDEKFLSSEWMMLWQLSVLTEYHVVRTNVWDLISDLESVQNLPLFLNMKALKIVESLIRSIII